jgi:hypothetical protein
MIPQEVLANGTHYVTVNIVTTNPIIQSVIFGITFFFGFKYARVLIKDLFRELSQKKIMRQLPGVPENKKER